MIRILAPAKVNFGLWVNKKREDGYHEIFSIMHAIDLYDEIYIEPSHTLEIYTVGPFSKSIETNIVQEAVEEFAKLTDESFDYKITIQKNIPVGAGLGGASSDLASVINYLNTTLKTPLSYDELVEFLMRFSKDAPFFLKGGCVIAYGLGEKIHSISHMQREVTIVYPNVESSTKKVYQAFKSQENDIKLEDILRLLEEKPLEEIIENHLQETAIDIYKEIGEVMRFLQSFGYKPYMSGSGSSVYIFGHIENTLKNAILTRGWYIYECNTI